MLIFLHKLLNFICCTTEAVFPPPQWQEEPTQSSLREFSRFTFHLLQVRVPVHQRWATSWAILFPTIFSAVTCLNVFHYFIYVLCPQRSISEVSEPFDKQPEKPTPSPFADFSIILPTLEHDTESTIFWQTMLETFVDNSSPHFFSLHPLGFYMSKGSLHDLAEKVTALSCRV